MDPFLKIVLVVDRHGAASPAVRLAGRLARAGSGRVILVAVGEVIPWLPRLLVDDAPRIEETLRAEMTRLLADCEARLRHEGISVESHLSRGKLGVEVEKVARAAGADLIVKQAAPPEDPRGEAGDMQLIRESPASVWLVRGDWEEGERGDVLAAVDPPPAPDDADLMHIEPSESAEHLSLDDRILNVGKSVTTLLGGELHAVNAYEVPGEPLLSGEVLLTPQQIDSYIEAFQTVQRRALDALVARHGLKAAQKRTHLIHGPAAQVIAETARTLGVGLLVMGSVSRTGLPGFLLGNTAEAVAREVPCSILVVKPKHP